MWIKRLDLSCAVGDGLKPRVMDRLGPLVVLAGPNGSGKSRILEIIDKTLAEKGAPQLSQEALLRVAQMPPRTDTTFAALRSTGLINYFTNNPGHPDVRNEIVGRYFSLKPGYEPNCVHAFFPKDTRLADYRKQSELNAENAERTFRENLAPESLGTHAQFYIVRIARRAAWATGPSD
jgi:hypothetical protein